MVDADKVGQVLSKMAVMPSKSIFSFIVILRTNAVTKVRNTQTNPVSAVERAIMNTATSSSLGK